MADAITALLVVSLFGVSLLSIGGVISRSSLEAGHRLEAALLAKRLLSDEHGADTQGQERVGTINFDWALDTKSIDEAGSPVSIDRLHISWEGPYGTRSETFTSGRFTPPG